MKKREFLQGFTFLALAQVMVAVNIVTSKLLLDSVPVLVLLEIRFALAFLVLLPLHFFSPARKQSMLQHFSVLQARDWWVLFAQAMFAGALFNCLMLTGLHYTDANLAGIITSALPAIVAVTSWIVLKEVLSPQKILSVMFATFGLIVIAYDKLGAVGAGHSFWGDAIVLLSLFPEAGYYVLTKLYPNRLPIFLTSSLLNLMNALLLLPTLIFVDWPLENIRYVSWFILFVIGLSSGLFYVFWFMGAKRVEGVLASISTAVMPIATVILAWMILHEQLSGMEFLGMGLVIFSIFLYARK